MTLVSNALACDDSKGDVLRVHPNQSDALVCKRDLPSWLKEQCHLWGERFCLPEWDGDEDGDENNDVATFRADNEWKVSCETILCCMLYFAHFFVRVTEARGLQMTMRRGRIYVIQSHLPSEYHTTQFNTLM
jgi:hypothetical protein